MYKNRHLNNTEPYFDFTNIFVAKCDEGIDTIGNCLENRGGDCHEKKALLLSPEFSLQPDF